MERAPSGEHKPDVLPQPKHPQGYPIPPARTPEEEAELHQKLGRTAMPGVSPEQKQAAVRQPLGRMATREAQAAERTPPSDRQAPPDERLKDARPATRTER